MKRRRRDQRGATLIEAAFVLPLLFLLLLTTIDFADWAFQVNQANGAARDGARVGIIHYQQADTSSSTDLGYINSAITNRLAGQTYSLVGGTANCIQPTSATTLSTGCAGAVPGCDRIQVKVQWSRTPWSPFGSLIGTETVHGEAEMTIAGAPSTPPTSVDSTGCP